MIIQLWLHPENKACNREKEGTVQEDAATDFR